MNSKFTPCLSTGFNLLKSNLYCVFSSQNDEFYAKALNLFTQGTVSTIVASDDVIGKLANVREFDYIVNLDLPKK